ncbi:MAG: hypothetical protein JWO86_6783 [Myxococcaceae bacterium]|nr:hypothetical protein [Myxococcaceae bacterium]
MPRPFFSPARTRGARLVFAALLVITASNHGRLAAAGAGNVTRHEVFVGLNVALALLLVARPRWALGPAALLSAQQLYSHGSDLLESIEARRHGAADFDWASVGVLVFFPALLTLLVVERRRAGTPEPPRAAPPGS